MVRIEYSEYLLMGIATVVITLAIFYYLWKRRETILERIGNATLLDTLLPDFSPKKWWWLATLLTLSIGSLFLAAANPQWGSASESLSSESTDIYIAFDISQSMLANDEVPSRMDRAKRFTEKLITALKGNRIGVVFFAGEAYLQMPLTLDYAAAISAIKTAHPQYAGRQGTSLSEAIQKAVLAYKEGDAKNRALIIISDGEDHEAEAEKAAQEAYEDGMVVFTVGVGTKKGAYVPDYENGRPGYKKDKQGNPVLSKINPEMLRNVAASGKGAFYMVNQDSDAIDNLTLRLDNYEKSRQEEKSFDVKNSYFQIFIGLALLLLGIQWYFENSYNRTA